MQRAVEALNTPTEQGQPQAIKYQMHEAKM